MVKRFMTDRERILVAVAFDDHTLPLIKAGEELCRRTGKELRLVHVVEPWLENVPLRPLREHSPLWDVGRAVEEDARSRAERRLLDLAKDLTVPNDVRVFSGKPSDWISAEALANRACLILVGRGDSSRRFVPRGLSTALTLMANSPVPVMVLGKDDKADFAAQELRVIVADDLSSQSEAAVAAAFELATALRNVALHHVHITGLTPEVLETGLKTAQAASHTPATPIDASEIYEDVIRHISDRMAERTLGREEYLEASGGKYVRVITSGDVATKVHELVEEIHPDLIVFGRHQTVHRKPFLIGRMPFKTMLAENCPILLAAAE